MIDQKAREIAEQFPHGEMTFHREAARLGIIEGLEMAERKLAQLWRNNRDNATHEWLEGIEDARHEVRALIEEAMP